MTKKHYEAIADIIRNCIEAEKEMCGNNCTIKIIATTKLLADYFQQDNPKFKREKFLQACGIETS